MIAYMSIMAEQRNATERNRTIHEARIAEANLQRSEQDAWSRR